MLYNPFFKCELNFREKELYFWTIFMREITVRQLQVHSVYCPAFGQSASQSELIELTWCVLATMVRIPKFRPKFDALYHSNKEKS